MQWRRMTGDGACMSHRHPFQQAPAGGASDRRSGHPVVCMRMRDRGTQPGYCLRSGGAQDATAWEGLLHVKGEHIFVAQVLARADLHMVQSKRLQWWGHVLRMGDARLPNRLVHSWLPNRAGKGRLLKCWTVHMRSPVAADIAAQLVMAGSGDECMEIYLETVSNISGLPAQ